MTAKTRLTYFSGALLREEMERRGWTLAALAFEVGRRSGLMVPTTTLAGALQAGAEVDGDGRPRLHHQPNATLALAMMAALELPPNRVLAKT